MLAAATRLTKFLVVITIPGLRGASIMQITDVRIRIAQPDSKLKGFATVTFDDCFAVHNIKILEGANGLFLAMPSRDTLKGGRRDIAHPINAQFRSELETRIIDAFHEAKAAGPI